MPRGSNPKSWNNKPTVPGGVNSTITLTSEQWGFLKVIGQGNKAKGGREVVRAMQVIAKKNWSAAATMLKCEASPAAISKSIISLYPGIQKGRKTQDDLIQELALGECSLGWHNDKIVRVINLVLIEVRDGDRYLVETYQQLASGEIFPRNIRGVAEKIQYPETPHEAALRGLEEELGVVPKDLKFLSKSFEVNPKSKYEGIESYAKKHKFLASLNPEDIQEEYQEFREGDLTVFRWVS